MIKDRTTIEIDAETKLKLKKLNIQIGPACNNFLRNLTNAYFNDADAEELYSIEDRLREIDEKISELSILKTSFLEKKEAILLKIKAQEKEDTTQAEKEVEAILKSGMMGMRG
jgi:hypothetical protein